MSLTVVIYLVGYLLFFIGYLVLIFKKKQLKRTYEIPGGTFGKAVVSICGLLVSLFTFGISFVPPSTLPRSSDSAYLGVLIISFIIALILPLIIYAFHHKWGGTTITMTIPSTSVPRMSFQQYHQLLVVSITLSQKLFQMKTRQQVNLHIKIRRLFIYGWIIW